VACGVRPERAVDASEGTGVDGLEGKEGGLGPDAIAVEQTAEACGDSVEVPEVVHDVWSLYPYPTYL
jgi:hypothetical protein